MSIPNTSLPTTAHRAKESEKILQGESRCHPECKLSPLGHLLEGVSCRHGCNSKWRRKSMSKLMQLFQRWLYRKPLLHGWLLELRSSLHRIFALDELRSVQAEGMDFGKAFETDKHGRVVLCRQTQRCILDIQQLGDTCQWMSPSDLQLYLDGWKRGAEWASALYNHGDTESRMQR
jgi:hypothetical protein